MPRDPDSIELNGLTYHFTTKVAINSRAYEKPGQIVVHEIETPSSKQTITRDKSVLRPTQMPNDPRMLIYSQMGHKVEHHPPFDI